MSLRRISVLRYANQFRNKRNQRKYNEDIRGAVKARCVSFSRLLYASVSQVAFIRDQSSFSPRRVVYPVRKILLKELRVVNKRLPGQAKVNLARCNRIIGDEDTRDIDLCVSLPDAPPTFSFREFATLINHENN